MIIECPACGARAKLPDSKEGAKVRCVECERIYVARPGGARKTSGKPGSALPVGIGAGVVALAIVLIAIFNRGGPALVVPPAEVPEAREVVRVDYGFNSPLCVFARGLHDAAAMRDEFKLQSSLDEERIWERLTGTPPDEAEVEPEVWERETFMIAVLDRLMAQDPDNLVGMWLPFDGKVLEEGDAEALVRLTLQPRDPDMQGGTRHVDWKLARAGSGWKAWSWERWISPEEEANNRLRRAQKTQKRTLSDGSLVLEAEPEPIAYMDSTPPQERARIDGLIRRLMDLDNLRPRELTEVRAELTVTGKPAIPPLLTKMYELDAAGWTEHSAMLGQQLHIVLQDITGYVTTFKAHEALGGTIERRDSGVKQWFSWYNRKFERFDARPEEEDLLETAIVPRNEAERRELEKYRRLSEQENDGN